MDTQTFSQLVDQAYFDLLDAQMITSVVLWGKSAIELYEHTGHIDGAIGDSLKFGMSEKNWKNNQRQFADLSSRVRNFKLDEDKCTFQVTLKWLEKKTSPLPVTIVKVTDPTLLEFMRHPDTVTYGVEGAFYAPNPMREYRQLYALANNKETHGRLRSPRSKRPVTST